MLAGGLHLAAVVPVKVIQEGGVPVQLLAGADGAAGVLLPGTALGGEDTGLSPPLHHSLLPPPASLHFILTFLLPGTLPHTHREDPSVLGLQEPFLKNNL